MIRPDSGDGTAATRCQVSTSAPHVFVEDLSLRGIERTCNHTESGALKNNLASSR